ncbi:MAG: PTS sugar transporter subunit IIC [Bacilli bacterium]|jgi:uncharacterized membrane protein|nr:PTS sugar transporter subunit IIC [Bacilli bacterium]
MGKKENRKSAGNEPVATKTKEGGSLKDKLIAARGFLATTTNGMAIGLFGTLIIGTIIALFAKIPGCESIDEVAKLIKGLMGAGIGLGVALSLKLSGVEMVSVMAAGALGNLAFDWFDHGIVVVTDPLCCYVSSLIAYAALKGFHRRRTPVDLILIPLLALLFSVAFTYLLSFWVHYLTVGIGLLIELSFEVIPFIMCVIVSALVGMALTAPISSVAICVAINIGSVPLAAGAALIGCCTQMVGFAVHTAHDNKWGSVLAVGIGTSMLQFKNIVRKPIIWLPTIIASAVLGPFALLFGFASDSVGAGMGTSGLVGLINTFDVMGYDPAAIGEILAVCVAAPILLTWLLDLLFRKIGWIKKGDFALSSELK